jgi:class 3 adenylate cyclase
MEHRKDRILFEEKQINYSLICLEGFTIMEGSIHLPLIEDLAPGILKFGAIVLVEFQSHSLWYEASHTLAAQALREGIKTDYHTFQHPPDDIRKDIASLDVDLDDFEKSGKFRLIDSYTAQIGLGTPKTIEPYGFTSTSLKIADWKSQMFGVFDKPEERRLIHIDENDSVLTNYNTEAEVLDFFRRSYTAARGREFVFFYALLSGTHSASFYNQFESLADIIIDFQSPEESGRVNHMVRVRIARGSGKYNSEWRRLKVLQGGEVTLDLGASGVEASTERKLAAIMFTDMVGYSSLSEKNETLSLELLEEHRKILRATFPKHHGIEVKTIGDGFLVEFQSALEALECANEIQESLHKRNVARRQQEGIVLRIGIHLGDVIHSSSDVYGDAVNIASRIEAFADPGGICITQQVFDHVKKKSEFQFRDIGKKELKHASAPIEIYSAILPWEKAPEA